MQFIDKDRKQADFTINLLCSLLTLFDNYIKSSKMSMSREEQQSCEGPGEQILQGEAEGTGIV